MKTWYRWKSLSVLSIFLVGFFGSKIYKNSVTVWIKLKTKNLKLAFKRKKYYYPLDNLQLLTTAKFERLPIPKQITQVGFFSCANCIYHKNGYLKNVYLFRSNPKINCWLGTIDAFLVVTVKMLCTYLQ